MSCDSNAILPATATAASLPPPTALPLAHESSRLSWWQTDRGLGMAQRPLSPLGLVKPLTGVGGEIQTTERKFMLQVQILAAQGPESLPASSLAGN